MQIIKHRYLCISVHKTKPKKATKNPRSEKHFPAHFLAEYIYEQFKIYNSKTGSMLSPRCYIQHWWVAPKFPVVCQISTAPNASM